MAKPLRHDLGRDTHLERQGGVCVPQIVKASGGEFLLIDMEHNGATFDQVKTQAALCRGIGIVPLARVPTGQYNHIARALDAGVMGIMVPMVGSAEEARSIVRSTRYPPEGRRGAAFGSNCW